MPGPFETDEQAYVDWLEDLIDWVPSPTADACEVAAWMASGGDPFGALDDYMDTIYTVLAIWTEVDPDGFLTSLAYTLVLSLNQSFVNIGTYL